MSLDDKVFKRDTLWLYSAKYNNQWWCYDYESSLQLDKIYADFLKRNVVPVDSDNINDTSVAQNLTEKNISTNKTSFDPVDYNAYSDTTCVDNCTELSYVLKIGSNQFKIDFEHWQQINCQDNRTRKIRNVKLPSNRTDLMDYIVNDLSIKGVSGQIWN